MKRVLVVGGTGFIGLAVVDALLEQGIEVARSIAGMGRLSSKLAKSVMNSLFRVRPDVAALLEGSAQAVLFETEEKHNRMQAFLDRKKK